MHAQSPHTMRRALRSVLGLAAGSIVYRSRGITPAYAYQSLIHLFCLTSGRSNDWLARLLSLVRPPYRLPEAAGALGELSTAELNRVAGILHEQGYYVFPARLSPKLCRQLLDYALTQRCVIRPTDADSRKGVGPRMAVYDRSAPEGIIYEFNPDDLVNNPDIQALMADASIVAVAQAYIGSRPVLDEVNLWWSTGFRREADSNAAQLYHFDMDRIRWLKFFIYLTDVTADSGPHCFVAGSHKTFAIPGRFLSRGYARLTDEEVSDAFPRDALIEFTGPAGTIFAEDTRGLHKGKPVHMGDRLVLEFEFSNSLFGATPSATGRLRTLLSPQLMQFVERYRRMYARWLEQPH